MPDPWIPAGLLPSDGADWQPVLSGASGATVLHDHVWNRYAKIVPAAQAHELVAERDRIVWLNGTGMPGAPVLDWRVSDAGACLITRAVPGITADRLGPAGLKRAWPAVADTVRELHAIPASQCPFGLRLATMMTAARATVAENRVQVEFLPLELQHTPATSILEQLEAELPRRLTQERTTQVVCHGDLCLPNILIDPDTSQVSGFTDLGRLGRADPYADIAVLLASAGQSLSDERAARQADDTFARRYGLTLNAGRRSFYLRLDPLTW